MRVSRLARAARSKPQLFWNVGGGALSHANFTAYDLDAVEIFAKIKRTWSPPPHVHHIVSTPAMHTPLPVWVDAVEKVDQ